MNVCEGALTADTRADWGGGQNVHLVFEDRGTLLQGLKGLYSKRSCFHSHSSHDPAGERAAHQVFGQQSHFIDPKLVEKRQIDLINQ